MPGYQLRTAVQPKSDGYFGLLRLGDVSGAGVDESDLLRMDLDVDEMKFRIEDGDVLCRSRGGNYRAAVAGAFRRPTIALAPLYIYRARRSTVLPEYVAWWLNMPEAQRELEMAAIGSNIKTVSIGAFADLAIPLVPLDLQRKVVQVDRLNREERGLEHELAEKRAQHIERTLAEVVRTAAMENGR